MEYIEKGLSVVFIAVLLALFIFSMVDRDDTSEYEPVAPVQEPEEENTGELEVVDRTEVYTVEEEPPFSFWIDPSIPLEVQDAAHYYGDIYNISPQFLEAIAWKESRYDPTVEAKGCIGLMQINERWHLDRMERLEVNHDGLYTVNGSMAVAADYLAELFEAYEDPAVVLMVYNGDSSVDEYIAGGEASEYATSILEMTRDLEIRYDAR